MSRIIATGSYLPERVVTNKELIEKTAIDSNDEWIVQRTGIQQRHFADAAETVSDIATHAARDLLKQLDETVLQDIQLIIVATMSSKLPTPAVASQVQRALGIQKSWAFDVSGACAGFVMALEMAEKISRDYTDGYTLVIGAEKMSNLLNFDDRSTSILFGDGAGAVLIANDGRGLPGYASQLTSIPDLAESIYLAPEDPAQELMAMEGRAVFNFVLRQVIPSLTDFIESQGGDFDYLLSHQANYRFIEIIAKKLRVPITQVPSNIAQVANTSAGSIPILLDALVQKEDIRLDGRQKVVFVGYGAGLAWGQISLQL